MRANREDEEHGRFFQDRYKATRLTDEASLLACAAYVDLNPIRAALCEQLEESDFTSVQRRIEAEQERAQNESPVNSQSPRTPAAKLRHRRDSFLSPVSIDELLDPIGPCRSKSEERCSEKGFLAMSLANYLELLDWTARQVVSGKRGKTPASVPPILRRLGLDQASWCELVRDFGKLFCTVAGSPDCVDAMRSHRTHRRYHMRRRASQSRIKLLPAIGVLCQPNPFTRYDIFFPEPRLAKYWTTLGTQDVWWYVAGDLGGGSWTVTRANAAQTEERVDLNQIEVMFGFEWGRSDLIRMGQRTAFIEFGGAFYRELKYQNPVDDQSLANSFLIRAGFGY